MPKQVLRLRKLGNDVNLLEKVQKVLKRSEVGLVKLRRVLHFEHELLQAFDVGENTYCLGPDHVLQILTEFAARSGLANF